MAENPLAEVLPLGGYSSYLGRRAFNEYMLIVDYKHGGQKDHDDELSAMLNAYQAILDGDPAWCEINARIRELKARAKQIEQRAAETFRKVWPNRPCSCKLCKHMGA